MYIIKILISIYLSLLFLAPETSAKALIGEISKQDYKINRPQVIDSQTKLPINDASVSVPTENQVDFTDENGFFKLTPSSNKPVILSIQKEGYRPFSLTLQDGTLKGGLVFELKKSNPLSIIVTDNLLHLGDNSYSEKSSGACLINSPCVGPSFSQEFKIKNLSQKTKAYVSIGSVIGIDTIQAMKLGQNRLTNAASTPVEIFVNKTKIGELKINGDNQKIPIPTNLLKENNTLTVKTGKNRDALDIDYDDIELMNLIVDIEE